MPPFSSDTHTSGDNSQVETNTEAISSNAVGLEAHSSYLTTLSATQSGLMTALTSVGEKADSNTAAIVTNSAELVNLNTGFSGLGASLIGFMDGTTASLATKADKNVIDDEIAELSTGQISLQTELASVNEKTDANSAQIVTNSAELVYINTGFSGLGASLIGFMDDTTASLATKADKNVIDDEIAELSTGQISLQTELASVAERTDENTAAILKNANALVAKAAVSGSADQSFNTGNLTVSGTIDVAGELIIDGVAEIGQGKIGIVPGQGDTNAGFAKTNHFTSTNYALLQYNGGATNLNAVSGTSLTFTKGDTATMVCKPDNDWDIRTNLHVFNNVQFGDNIVGNNHGTLGQIPGMAQNVGFSKTNFFNQTDFALAQYDNGQVDLNAPANAGLYLKQGGVSKMNINASTGEIDVQTNVNVDGELILAGTSVSTVLNTLTAGAIANTSAIDSLTVKTQSLLTNFTDIVPEVEYLIEGIHMAQDYSNRNSDRIIDLKIEVDAKANQTDVTSSALDFLALNTKLIAMQTELTELKGAGTVAQVVTFQTREMKLNDDGVNIGYSILENNTSLGRLTKTQGQLSHIDKFQDVVISPKSAGNKILISFVLSYSVTGDFADWGFVVTRFNRVTQEEIMIAFNDGPSNRAILATEFDGSIDHADDDATGIWNVITGPVADNRNNRSNATTVRITDESCLDVSTTYRLYVRGTDNANTNRTIFYLNGPGGDMSPGRGAAGTTSSLTLTEIRSVVPVPVTILPVVVPAVPVVLVP